MGNTSFTALYQLGTDLDKYPTIDLLYLEKHFIRQKNELKFVFHKTLLPDLFELLKHNYYLLIVNEQHSQLYKTYYYDTPAFDLYYQAYLKKTLRYKIRWRNYLTTNTGFLEIKSKKDTGHTHKYKLPCNQFTEQFLDPSFVDFIQTYSPFHPHNLHPVIFTQYYRTTLLHKNHSEKITIDTHLSFNNFQEEKKFEHLVILEIKTAHPNINLEISNALKKLNINKKTVSKYSIGIALMYPNIKKNLFLPYIKLLETINSNTIT